MWLPGRLSAFFTRNSYSEVPPGTRVCAYGGNCSATTGSAALRNLEALPCGIAKPPDPCGSRQAQGAGSLGARLEESPCRRSGHRGTMLLKRLFQCQETP